MKILSFDTDRLNLPEFTLPEFTLPEFTMPEFTMPEFTMPEFTMPDFDLPSIDLAGGAEVLRDAAFAIVGVGVVAVEQLSAAGTKLTKQVERWTAEFGSTVRNDIVPQVQAVARTATQQARELLRIDG